MMSSMKPAPLQFVKLAPSDLYRSAQDQLNKTAVVVKPKPKEFDAEWQSDLDNWKSNRRKQQEHIIERLVEVKKFETDRLDDGFRKRSKTFNEMIQERGKSGRLRSLPALYQDDDDGNDLSDLGLSTGKKTSVNGDEPPRECHRPEVAADRVDEEDVFRAAEEQPVAATAAVKVATVTATDSVENGYDRAIKDYVDFAESKRRTTSNKCDEQQQHRPAPGRKPPVEVKRRMSAPRIEEKVMLLKTRSQSTKDLNATIGELPRVDIVKRREIFEKICSSDTTKSVAEAAQQPQHTFVRQPPPPPLLSAKNKKPFEVSSPATVVWSQVIEEISPPKSPSPPPVIESSKIADEPTDEQTAAAAVVYSLKEEVLQQLHCAATVATTDAAKEDGGEEMTANIETTTTTTTEEEEEEEIMADEEKPIVALEKERVCLQVGEEDEYHQHNRHQQQLSPLSDLVSRHSIDSLDQECGGHTADDPDDGNYPGSCLSAEDSGVHTEDMSSCVSQADDEERSNLQPSPVLLPLSSSSNVVHHQQAVDDAYNMVLELTPVNALEPPKEKPPPPPVDACPDNDDNHYHHLHHHHHHHRHHQVPQPPPQGPIADSLESAKRIKKEMWMKRSSFLGLEEYANGNAGYEHDLENLKSRPPDLTSFLEEERRLEKLLYNQNKLERHDTTRIYENVNVIVPPTTNNNMYANDDDDDRCSVGGGGGGDSESSQYMRDILQVEEQSRCNQLKNKVAQNNIGEKLVKKLKELEEDLMNNQQQQQQQQECVRVGSAHWLPPPTRHSMQDISSSTAAATRPSSLDHTRSMPNLEQQPIHSQHHQPEDFAWSSQNGCPSATIRPAATQQNVLAKRKPPTSNGQSEKYNYQHWLIQEAEHRRLVDKCNRQVPPGAIASNQPLSRSRPSLPPPPPPPNKKPLPDSVINTLTQRVQDRLSFNDFQRHDHVGSAPQQESMLSVSGKKKCSHCAVELGRGAAMIIESLQLFYHIECFKCCVCCVQLGDGLMGTDVRVRNKKLHCHNCFSSDDGVKFSCV